MSTNKIGPESDAGFISSRVQLKDKTAGDDDAVQTFIQRVLQHLKRHKIECTLTAIKSHQLFYGEGLADQFELTVYSIPANQDVKMLLLEILPSHSKVIRSNGTTCKYRITRPLQTVQFSWIRFIWDVVVIGILLLFILFFYFIMNKLVPDLLPSLF